jgi:hypothetical protein
MAAACAVDQLQRIDLDVPGLFNVTLGSVGITAVTRAQVKVTHKMNNGSGQNEVKFWYSTNNGFTWKPARLDGHAFGFLLDRGHERESRPRGRYDVPLPHRHEALRLQAVSGIGGTLKQSFIPSSPGWAAPASTRRVGTWNIGSDSSLNIPTSALYLSVPRTTWQDRRRSQLGGNSITGDIAVQVDSSMVDYGPSTGGAQTLAQKQYGGAAWDLIVLDVWRVALVNELQRVE